VSTLLIPDDMNTYWGIPAIEGADYYDDESIVNFNGLKPCGHFTAAAWEGE